MSRKESEKKAHDYFTSGFNCAEAVLMATAESRMDCVDKEHAKAASALGGGIGGTREEVCGALSGGVLAIGLLYGRTEPGVDVDFAKDLAAEFRARFLEKFGTTKCGVLLEQFGEQENDEKCAELTGAVAGLLSDLLDERG